MSIQIKNDNVLISDINSLQQTIGGGALATSAQTLIGAINENYATINNNYTTLNTKFNDYLPLTGGTLTGSLSTGGADIILGTSSTTSDDSGDIVFRYGNGSEKSRIWTANEYTTIMGPNYRVYDTSGTQLYSGRLQIEGNYTYNNAWNISSSSGELTTSLSIATHGRPVLILFSWDMQGTAAGHWCTGAVYRGSTHLKSRTVVSASGSYNANGVITYLDVVSAGSYTYTFKLKGGSGTIQYNESNLYGNEQPTLCVFEI